METVSNRASRSIDLHSYESHTRKFETKTVVCSCLKTNNRLLAVAKALQHLVEEKELSNHKELKGIFVDQRYLAKVSG